MSDAIVHAKDSTDNNVLYLGNFRKLKGTVAMRHHAVFPRQHCFLDLP